MGLKKEQKIAENKTICYYVAQGLLLCSTRKK